MKREIKRDANGDVVCQICECQGNAKCGHNPPQWALDNGRGCGLDEYLVCPCCNEKHAAKGKTGKMCPVDCEPCDGCRRKGFGSS